MAKDVRLESYLAWLRERISRRNAQLKAAEKAYRTYQQTGQEKHRHECWQHIHAAAAEVGRRRSTRKERSRCDA